MNPPAHAEAVVDANANTDAATEPYGSVAVACHWLLALAIAGSLGVAATACFGACNHERPIDEDTVRAEPACLR